MTRSLRTRLREYADAMHGTSKQLNELAEHVESLHPDENAGTDGIRDLSKVQATIAGDLDKILRGEELQAFVMEVSSD